MPPICHLHRASTDILHVANGRAMTHDDIHLRSQLETVGKMLRSQEVPVTVRYITGDPAAHILAVAREVKADMIAMGVQGPTDVAYGVIGQTVNRVAQAGLCPDEY